MEKLSSGPGSLFKKDANLWPTGYQFLYRQTPRQFSKVALPRCVASCVLSKVLNINPVSKEGIPLGAGDWKLKIISSYQFISNLRGFFLVVIAGSFSATWRYFRLACRLSKPLRGSSATCYTANVHKRGSRW